MITLPLSFHFHQKMIFELGFSLKVISLLHPWVTCLPGCNRNTGAFVCLFCDYFAIKFSVSLKNDYLISFSGVILLLHPWVTCLPGALETLGHSFAYFVITFPLSFQFH